MNIAPRLTGVRAHTHTRTRAHMHTCTHADSTQAPQQASYHEGGHFYDRNDLRHTDTRFMLPSNNAAASPLPFSPLSIEEPPYQRVRFFFPAKGLTSLHRWSTG